MKVLVTGHLGYIGTVMTPMLLKEGYEVVGLDSDLYRGCTYSGEIVDVPTIKKDMRDIKVDDLRGIDAVCHLAALSNDPLSDLNESLTYDINHRASVRLAELAKEVGAQRYIFSSSCSNYGSAGDEFLDEQAEFNPVTAYGKSKVKVERDVAPLADDRFSPTFLRNATAYGVSPRLRFDLVLNNLIAWAVTTGKVMLKSDGSPWRPIVHIEDIARGFIAVLKAPREDIHNQAFNIGQTSENYRVRELAEIVGETVPNCEVAFAEGASADKRNYRVNCDKAARVLKHFQPQWNARKATEQLYETYKSTGLTLESFEGPQFQRIAHIQKLLGSGELNKDLRFTG